MPVYLSCHQPRKQTTLCGNIGNVETYDRFYDITWDALKARVFPHFRLPAGRLVVRTMDGPYNSRQIPPGSSMNPRNRFSGPRLDGRPGQGALYVGTIGGVLREYTHYALPRPSTSPLTRGAPPPWRPGALDSTSTFMRGLKSGAPPLRATTKFYLYRTVVELRFADLRLPALVPLMQRLRSEGGGQRYGIVAHSPVDFQVAAASDSQDYSAARGVADAVFDQREISGDHGVCALSSRADRDNGLVLETHGDATGGLVFAIFGRDSSVVSALQPVAPNPAVPAQAGFDTIAELIAAVSAQP